MARRVLPMLLATLLTACGLKDLFPTGPVQTPWQRIRGWGEPLPSGTAYTSEPRAATPVLPFPVFGVTYDLDIVLRSKHPAWDMHEIAMVRTPEGPLWLVKDARASTLAQAVVADIDDINGWMPEIPVQRKSTPVAVTDRSTEDWLDLEVAYENLDGEPTVLTYAGHAPRTLQAKRNGNTMGHSRDAVMVALDLSYRDFGKRASVTIGGRRWPIVKVLGLVPMQLVLQQTQGGMAIGRHAFAPEGEGLRSTTDVWGEDVEQAWTLEPGPSGLDVVQRSAMRTLAYHFRDAEGALELTGVTVTQWDRPTPTAHLALNPALPDLRRRFEGRRTSRFALDVDGQPDHAVGRIEAWWEGDGVQVAIRGEAPEWVVDRPLTSRITWEGDAVEVLTARDRE